MRTQNRIKCVLCYILVALFVLPPFNVYGQAPQSPPPAPPSVTPQPQQIPQSTIRNPQSPPPAPPSVTPQPQQIPQSTIRNPQSPPPPSSGGGGNVVQMNFDNIELRDLIRFVSNIMGKNFVYDENVVKGKVTILAPKNLTKDDVMRVFDTVINYYGFAVVQTPEAIKVVKGADAKGMAVEILNKEKLSKLPPEDRMVTYIANLDYLDSNIMVGVLRPLLSRDAYLVSVAATNSLIMIDTASNIHRIKNILTETDIAVSKQLSGIKVYNVQHTIAAELAKVLQQLMLEGKKAQTPKEKIFITSYPTTNSLLISAPLEDMKEIERIIGEIDTLRPQVLVEAAIIEVSTKKGQELGVEWLTNAREGGVTGGFVQSDGSLLGLESAIIGAATATSPTLPALKTGFNVAIFGSNITWGGKRYPSVGAFIRAISTADNVNILSTPQILTMNNEEAEIKVGENRPYTTSTRVDTAGLPINSYDYRDVGITLKVKPSINKDGFVYLNIQQEVTKVTQDMVQTGSTTSIPAPTTLKRSTKTTVGVRDSQTIVISGLIEDDSEAHSSGIPFLNSIPILGYLFGNKSKLYDKKNLLIFITPRIIYNSQQIEDITKTQKDAQDKVLKRETDIKKKDDEQKNR